MLPCKCPLCRTPLRQLPRGSRSYHCSRCGETITAGFLRAWCDERIECSNEYNAAVLQGPRMLPMPEVDGDAPRLVGGRHGQ